MKQQILIVDDRRENLVALRKVLGRLDAEIVEATSGNEALAATIDHHFAIALLDVNMPGMSGHELAGLLRGDEKTRGIPIIFLTGSHADERHVFQGYEAGGIDYLVKPFDPQVLLGKVRVFLELDRSREELRMHRDHLETLVEQHTAELRDGMRQVRQAANQWQTTFDAMHDAVAILDTDRTILRCNAAMCRLLGKPLDQIVGRSCCELAHHVQEPPAQCPAVRGSRTLQREVWQTGIGDRWFDIVADPILDEAGRWNGTVHVLTDITERRLGEAKLRQANRMLRTISQCNQTLVRAASEAELLERTCQHIVESGGYPLACIALVDGHASARLRLAASAGNDGELLERIRSECLRTGGKEGPAAEAVCTCQPVTVGDLRSAPLPCLHGQTDGRRGLGAAISLPLASDRRVFGALTVCAGAAEDFDEKEVAFLRDLSADVGYGIAALRTRAERDRTEAEVNRMSQQRQLALSSARLGWWRYDPLTATSTWDERYAEIFGVSGFGRPNEEILKLIHPDDLPRVWAAVEAALNPAAPKPYAAEYRVNRPDGHQRWVAAHALAEFAGEGDERRAVSFVGTVEDVTERRRGEEELLHSRYDLSVKNSIAEICLTASDEEMYERVLRVVLETTHSEYGVFGYLDEQGSLVVPTMTRHVWDRCKVPDKDVVFPRETWGDSIWPRSIRQKQTLWSNERSELTPAGHVEIRRNISLPILYRGEPIGLLQVANKETDYDSRDIRTMEKIAAYVAPLLNARLQRDREEAARNAAEHELRRHREDLEELVRERTAELESSEARYRQLFEQAPDSVVLVDAQTGRLVEFNTRAHEALGYTREEFRQLTIPDFEVVESPDDVAAHMAKIRREGSDTFETKQRTKTGEVRDIRAKVAALDLGGQTYLHCIWIDITDRKRAEQAIRELNADLRRRQAELEAANSDLESFAYSVSHDLRSPLRGVAGYSKLLLADHAAQLDEDGQFMLGQVHESALEMGQLIDDILAFSRLGRQEMQFQRCDLAEMARDLFREMEQGRPDRRLRLELGGLPPCAGDPAMLREVLRNLLENAVKYTGPRAEAVIEVGARPAENSAAESAADDGRQSAAGDPQVVYFVRDNGVGFDAKFGHKLFKVFQRLHGAGEFDGTGIGLALVHRIVQRHGGQVWAESELDHGATFYISLPCERGEASNNV